MRWHALGVDYEMSGKDLIDSVRLSGRVCQVLGSAPPVGFTYELFLDEHAPEDQQEQGQRAQRWRSGCAMRRRRAWRSSCTTSRSGPSGCSST